VQRFCGHGIGRAMHMQPMVWHCHNNDQLLLRPGMIFTVEPMVTRGQWDCSILEDGWTVVTNDGSRTAQFEHTVLITESGVEVLTAYNGEQLEYDPDERL
jgi:methionyl aminopeptidase